MIASDLIPKNNSKHNNMHLIIYTAREKLSTKKWVLIWYIGWSGQKDD